MPDLIKLDKDLKSSQKAWGNAITEYHNITLNPKIDEQTQAVSIAYYTEQVIALLGLVEEFSKYYRSRSRVDEAITVNMLKVSDAVEKLLHQQDFSKLLEDINDNGGKTGSDVLLHSNVSANKPKRSRVGKASKLSE